MILTELRIENFRMFGEGDNALAMPIRPGLTAIIGENDSGKTAVIDALRLALGTRDQDFLRVDESDFHQDGSSRGSEIRIRCRFEHLTLDDCRDFLEYLTYEEKNGEKAPALYLNWKAVEKTTRSGRKRVWYEVRSGVAGDGPVIDPACRESLFTTYLRPLRDAERALASGRGSRLSQILQNTKEIRDYGCDYEFTLPPEKYPELSVLGIGTLADSLLSKHKGVQDAHNRLNDEYLRNLSFSDDPLKGHISVSSSRGDDNARLRQLLEKFELELRDEDTWTVPRKRGLGSNNLLFIACELLLAGPDGDGLPLLLIEEPEAHLHPQRQLRLMQFLQKHANPDLSDGQGIQIIVTTHSPNLASVIDLDNLVLMHNGKAYSLAYGQTGLRKSDYGFLKRFLDVTKANLFFARGVIIVEGDAENILLPTLASLLGRDLTEYGVSIVNVGGTGLRRFARIFLRKDTERNEDISLPGEDIKKNGEGRGSGNGTGKKREINIPVACVADLDVMPNCAPKIIGKVEHADRETWPEKRRWKVKCDFDEAGLLEYRENIRNKAHSQHVKTFVADEWTLEYDLAYSGLAREVWIAASFAKADDRISEGEISLRKVYKEAQEAFARLLSEKISTEELASHVYASFVSGSKISKATTAQYLAWFLRRKADKRKLKPEYWRSVLPPYLVEAIEYATGNLRSQPDEREEVRVHE